MQKKNILIIGGTRYFGKNLVQLLISAGHQVTIATRGRTPDPFGDKIQRIVVDRWNEKAMFAAFSHIEGYDIIYDQMCYNPMDALISSKVFYGRVKRYVMSSSIAVYAHLRERHNGPFLESDLNIHGESVDVDFLWHDSTLTEELYCIGKRQAEAYLYQDGALPVVSVRIAHVLGGVDDFTGRFRAYVQRVLEGKPIKVNAQLGETSFLESSEIAKFLVWVGEESFLGPINAGCDGALTSSDLYLKIAQLLHKPIILEPSKMLHKDGELAPFDYTGPYSMDMRRANRFGYRFNHIDQWLEKLAIEHSRTIKDDMPIAVGAGY